MDKETVLNHIFGNDPLGLLEIRAINPVVTSDDRLIATFKEINDFFDKNGCEPNKSTDMNERGLFARLKGLRNNPDKIQALKIYDRFNLLADN
jgi:hypothetical protein